MENDEDMRSLDTIPSREDVLRWCHDPFRKIISAKDQYPEVIQKGSFAIKHGNVSSQEAQNQREAWRLVDTSRVKVPRVYDFFEEESGSYLVMEHVYGLPGVQFSDQNVIDAIADALIHIHSLTGRSIGPISRGQWRGLLWDDAKPESVKSAADLEHFMNCRLAESERLSICGCDLVLTHLDIAPRNILMTASNVVCLLDWASAGYFPQIFEIAALRLNTGLNGCDSEYCRLLEGTLVDRNELHDNQLCDVENTVKFAHNSIRYSYAAQDTATISSGQKGIGKRRRKRRIDEGLAAREKMYQVSMNSSP